MQGCTSFEDVRTFEGVTYPTFKDACTTRGLLESDEEYDAGIRRVAHRDYPRSLRCYVAYMFGFLSVRDPRKLFDDHIGALTSDYVRRQHMAPDAARARCLRCIAYVVVRIQGAVPDWDELKAAVDAINAIAGDAQQLQALAEEFDPEPVLTNEEIAELQDTLNPLQREMCDLVLAAVDRLEVDNTLREKNVFFLAGKGGCGKTFTYRVIKALVEQRGKKVCVILVEALVIKFLTRLCFVF